MSKGKKKQQPQPRTDLAIDFLKTVHPNGPWALTAIAVDRKGIETVTFDPTQLNGLENWLSQYNGKRNIYWHINPVSKPVSKKAEREDIKEVSYLHVDIDPKPDQDLEEERKRALSLLKKKVNGVPYPTCILFSGGGIQAFWKLEEPIPINGDIGRAEDAKRYNMQLEMLFGADNCHNIDRIARLPGTINIPDAKKKKKGRQPELAELLLWEPDRVYPISDFEPAQKVQNDVDVGFAGETVKISGNIKRLDSVEDLAEWDVPDRVKVIVVQGTHPDETKEGDDSRSAWLFDCICQLVRANVPDEVIFATITDPDFGISASVLDKGTNSTKYAIRQIERAKEEAVDPWLRKLNEKHAVIGNLGGKCRVVEEVMDHVLNRPRITRQSFDDFANRYMNIGVEAGKKENGEPIIKKLGRWWLEHAKRRQFETMIFAPGKEVPNAYNLWKGFACEAKPGKCDLLLKHIMDNICCGNEEYYNYLVCWMARAVQNPDSPGQTAVVLKGRQGTGKGVFVKAFGSLFGRHFMQVADPKHLVGNFNSHLQDCVVLFGDEAFYAGDKKHESVLKMLITEETIAIEKKGIDVEIAPNCTHVLLASNNNWVIPAGESERRFFVLEVSNSEEQNAEYFKKISKEMENGGREALLYFLTKIDLTEFEVRNVPKTKALQEQKMLSLAPEEEWWYQRLLDGSQLNRLDNWRRYVKKDDVFADYAKYMQTIMITSKRSNQTTLGRFLAKMCPELRSIQKRALSEDIVNGEIKKRKRRFYFYDFPSLEICRKRWEDIYGKEDWPTDEELQFIEEDEDQKEEQPF